MRRLAAVIGALLAGSVHAAPFADPTQPPATGDGQAEGLGPRDGLRVESILIAPDRRLAVIDGQQVTIGGRVRGAAVVRITETEVVVRGADGEQRLKLFPDAGTRAAAGAKKGTSR